MNIICLICARENSKGLKNKNIKKFNGIPLIAKTIIQAKEMKIFKQIIVSTDSKKIMKISDNWGAKIPFKRPDYLAKDDSSEFEVWRHACKFLKKNETPIDLLVCLPCTSPLRKISDVKKAIKLYKKGNCDTIIGITESSRNPFFNMIILNKKKNAEIIIKNKKNIIRRQDAPKSFDITTNFFVINPTFILSKKNKHYIQGRVKTININKINSIDIDTQFDFEIAEFLEKKYENTRELR
tara:strand:- start:4 stop:720 length:717 start_codon:yes stop_codon:yes gene_type:complete